MTNAVPWYAVSQILRNRACHPSSYCPRAIILAPYHVVKSLQLIWSMGTRRWNLRVPILQMSCNDLTYTEGTSVMALVMVAWMRCLLAPEICTYRLFGYFPYLCLIYQIQRVGHKYLPTFFSVSNHHSSVKNEWWFETSWIVCQRLYPLTELRIMSKHCLDNLWASKFPD